MVNALLPGKWVSCDDASQDIPSVTDPSLATINVNTVDLQVKDAGSLHMAVVIRASLRDTVVKYRHRSRLILYGAILRRQDQDESLVVEQPPSQSPKITVNSA